ncbi:MAG: universal stress protein [Polyangiaceae bacterium]
MKIDNILVALDGSPRQPPVLAAAADLAVRYGAQLVLLRAIGVPPEIPPEAWQSPSMTLESFLQGKAQDSLQAALKALPEALQQSARVETVVAASWQGICVTAERINADLIVIGSHGYGGLDRLLGTTAARVVNHAQCAVLVVRPPSLPGIAGASHA